MRDSLKKYVDKHPKPDFYWFLDLDDRLEIAGEEVRLREKNALKRAEEDAEMFKIKPISKDDFEL